MMDGKRKLSHARSLAGIFDFTEGDLEVNRAGKISQRQLETLRMDIREMIGRHKLALVLTFLAGSIPCLCSVMASMLSFDLGGAFGNASYFAVLLPLITFLAPLILLVWVLRKRHWLLQDQDEGWVRIAEGTVTLAIQRQYSGFKRQPTPYTVWIGKEQFSLPEYQFLAFKNGDPYRVYFAPYSRTILSVEWLNTDPFE